MFVHFLFIKILKKYSKFEEEFKANSQITDYLNQTKFSNLILYTYS